MEWNTDHGQVMRHWSPNIMYPLCIYYVPVWARCDGCDVYWLIRSILPLCSTQLISYTYRNRHVSNVFQWSDLFLLVPKLFFHVGRAFHTIRIYSYPTFSQTLFISTWMNLNRLSLIYVDMIYSFNWHCWTPKIVKHHLPYMSDIYRAQIQNVSASGI